MSGGREERRGGTPRDGSGMVPKIRTRPENRPTKLPQANINTVPALDDSLHNNNNAQGAIEQYKIIATDGL